ncbi:extracellular solute-binding protein [Enterobacter cancerogenus]|uniref:Extracellular solute-binding protein n=1 Tax=Enterobacter cancerogenus TaxID=69218 RepID=A0A484Z7Z0_9ENTR|nr:extracellular solute-binding protein [Enterobacter cancerogenus]
MLQKALSSQQLASRIDAYDEAQNILARELPVLPLASSLRLQAYRYDIKGLVLSPFGNASFAGVSAREKEQEVKNHDYLYLTVGSFCCWSRSFF